MAVHGDNVVQRVRRILDTVYTVGNRLCPVCPDGIAHDDGGIPHFIEECIPVCQELLLDRRIDLAYLSVLVLVGMGI